MGAVLAQVHDGMEKAISYASKALSKSQTKYSATRRELLAIVTFTRHFRHYLLGRNFTIVTDHRAHQWLHNCKDLDGMTARWLERLASFNYTVHHRPGTSIVHADGLSRVPSQEVNNVAQNSSGNDAHTKMKPTSGNIPLWHKRMMRTMLPPVPRNGLTEKSRENPNFRQTFWVRQFVTKRSLATCSIQLTPSPIVSPPTSKCQRA